MNIQRNTGDAVFRRGTWTLLTGAAALLLIAVLSLTLARSPAFALSAEGRSAGSLAAETELAMWQIRSSIRDQSVTQITETHQVYLPIVARRWPPIPYAPHLSVSGLEGGVAVDGEYDLTWEYDYDTATVPAPTSYTLQEAVSADFSEPTMDETLDEATMSRSVTDKDDGVYYYRVRGHNAHGPGEWSNVVVVTVEVLPSADFYDDFTDPASGWLTHQALWGLVGCDEGGLQPNPEYKYSLFYADGRYKVNIPLDCRAEGRHGDTRHIYPVVFAPGVERPATRTCMEVRASFEHWDPWWSFYGLVFAASEDKSTDYSLEVNNRGDWAVLKRTGYDFPGPNHPWENEIRHKIVDWIDGPRWPARPGFEANTFRAEVNGDHVRLFINDHLVHQFTDSQISSFKRVGVIGGNWEITPTQIGFDHFYLDEGCDR